MSTKKNQGPVRSAMPSQCNGYRRKVLKVHGTRSNLRMPHLSNCVYGRPEVQVPELSTEEKRK